jgi:ribose 1,5-bisphosphokinase PhnN
LHRCRHVRAGTADDEVGGSSVKERRTENIQETNAFSSVIASGKRDGFPVGIKHKTANGDDSLRVSSRGLVPILDETWGIWQAHNTCLAEGQDVAGFRGTYTVGRSSVKQLGRLIESNRYGTGACSSQFTRSQGHCGKEQGSTGS